MTYESWEAYKSRVDAERKASLNVRQPLWAYDAMQAMSALLTDSGDEHARGLLSCYLRIQGRREESGRAACGKASYCVTSMRCTTCGADVGHYHTNVKPASERLGWELGDVDRVVEMTIDVVPCKCSRSG